MDAKLLTENGWKAVAQKFKIKDNGLQRALLAYEKFDDNQFADRLKGIASVSLLAGNLKKAKEVAAVPLALKYLTDVISAAELERREITNAKTLAEKSQALAIKAEAMADKKAEETAKKQEELEQQKADKAETAEAKGDAENARQKIGKLLLAGLQRVQSGGGKSLEWVCTIKDSMSRTPAAGLLVAPKVGMQHKQILTEVTGSKRFLTGTCLMEAGKLTFVVHGTSASATFVTQMRKSIQYFTKKTIVLRARGADDPKAFEEDPADIAAEAPEEEENVQPAAETQEPDKRQSATTAEPESAEPASRVAASFSLGASVGRGGKNKPADVQAVQTALNLRANAGLKVDGKCGPKTIAAIMAFQKTLGTLKPDGLVEPGRGTARGLAGAVKGGPAPVPPQPVAPPKLGKATLAKAPEVWHGTRGILDTNIGELKKAVRGHYANEHPDLFREIDQNLGKLDGILDKLDTKLADSLAKAHAAANDAARNAELKNSKAILADYIKYVKSEPLIAHIDSNPFGVDTNLKKVLMDSLTHMAQAIG